MKNWPVSIVIPIYKNTEIFLNNLKNNKKFFTGCELIIVNDDPATNIDSKINKIFPQSKIINNPKNFGFSKSVNLGIKNTTNEYILLLNSDVCLLDDSFKKTLIEFKRNPSLFAIAFAQQEKNNQIFGANIGYFKNGLIYHQKKDADNLNSPIINFWAEGGASIFNKNVLNQIGLFDEIYSPFYWEDVDLSYRAWKSGYQIYFDPKIKVIHHHETTIKKYFDQQFVKKIAFRNQLIFFWKNITDFKMLIIHFLYLPTLIFNNGFFDALRYLPIILKERKKLKEIYKKSDHYVLNLFSKQNGF